MVKVSVIVPVYNVEIYIKKCLDSLVSQTLKNIEIIIVNDGSPDNSQKIIDKYVEKYPEKIKSYKKKNGGLSSARNYGLKKAFGKYISFVDSYDYIDETMLEKMYNKAISNNFDLVVCDLDYVDDNSNFIMRVSSNINNDLFDEKVKRCMLNLYPAAWNKLYKRELFDKSQVKFKEGIWFEDVEFIYRLFPFIRSIGVVKDNLYKYVQRDGAITKTFDERLYNYVDNWNGIIDFYKNNNLYDEYFKELEFCYVRYLYATFVKQASNYKSKLEYDKAVDTAIKNVKDKFPNYRENKYFYRSIKGIYLVLFNKFIANIYYILNKK